MRRRMSSLGLSGSGQGDAPPALLDFQRKKEPKQAAAAAAADKIAKQISSCTESSSGVQDNKPNV